MSLLTNRDTIIPPAKEFQDICDIDSCNYEIESFYNDPFIQALTTAHPSASATKLTVKPQVWNSAALTFLRNHNGLSLVPYRETIIRQYVRAGYRPPSPPYHTQTRKFRLDSYQIFSAETFISYFEENLRSYNLGNIRQMIVSFIKNVVKEEDMEKFQAVYYLSIEDEDVRILMSGLLDNYFVFENFIILCDSCMVFLAVNDD